MQPRAHPERESVSCHCPGATKPCTPVCVCLCLCVGWGGGLGLWPWQAVATPLTETTVTLSPAVHPHQVARSRSGKTFTTGPRESLEEQLKPMIDWAITGFKPLGLKGLRPPKGSGEVVASAGWGPGRGLAWAVATGGWPQLSLLTLCSGHASPVPRWSWGFSLGPPQRCRKKLEQYTLQALAPRKSDLAEPCAICGDTGGLEGSCCGWSETWQGLAGGALG